MHGQKHERILLLDVEIPMEPFKKYFTRERVKGSRKKGQKVTKSGEGAAKKVLPLNISLRPFFLHLNFCSAISYEALIILQWATIRTHPRGSLHVWDSYWGNYHNFPILPTWLVSACQQCIYWWYWDSLGPKNHTRKIENIHKNFELYQVSGVLPKFQ